MTAKCNLIIDSCCDLPLEMVQREGVYLVEFPFLFDTEQHLDDFGVSMPAKEFYDRMRKGEVSGTAQIPVSELIERFESYAKDGTPTPCASSERITPCRRPARISASIRARRAAAAAWWTTR